VLYQTGERDTISFSLPSALKREDTIKVARPIRRSTVRVGGGALVMVGVLLSYSLVKVHLISIIAFPSGSFESQKTDDYFEAENLRHIAHKSGSFRGYIESQKARNRNILCSCCVV